MKREQFNFRTSLLSDEAYELIVQLSKSKQLSAQIAMWAEEHIKQNQKSQSTLDLVLDEIKGLKKWIQHNSEVTIREDVNLPFKESQLESKEPLQQLSSHKSMRELDQNDLDYDY
ncbi:hypothetical protein [Oceanobacillus salinisoli]|uniref:hypothetical protein n=1 Tax=Oceanobacillus salinisoli TaxID=2678611 RepID=UPI0012E1C807|nr:hypothetical protein [Oceanobacillus salinisoli]